VWGSAPNNVWAVGNDGRMAHYDGASWAGAVVFSDTVDLRGIWGRASDDILAVGLVSTGGGIIVHYDGDDWQAQSYPAQALWGVWGRAANDVFAVGDDHTILHYDGSSWTPMDSGIGPAIRLWDVWGRAADDVFAVGDLGLILHYDGSGWTLMEDSLFPFYGVWGSPASDVWAVGLYGAILHYPAPWRVFLPLVLRGS